MTKQRAYVTKYTQIYPKSLEYTNTSPKISLKYYCQNFLELLPKNTAKLLNKHLVFLQTKTSLKLIKEI